MLGKSLPPRAPAPSFAAPGTVAASPQLCEPPTTPAPQHCSRGHRGPQLCNPGQWAQPHTPGPLPLSPPTAPSFATSDTWIFCNPPGQQGPAFATPGTRCNLEHQAPTSAPPHTPGQAGGEGDRAAHSPPPGPAAAVSPPPPPRPHGTWGRGCEPAGQSAAARRGAGSEVAHRVAAEGRRAAALASPRGAGRGYGARLGPLRRWRRPQPGRSARRGAPPRSAAPGRAATTRHR